jgi:hypothetical protein
MKRILLIFVILSWFGSLQAQEKDKNEVIGPVKGTITASMIFGNATTNSGWLQLPGNSQSSYSVYSPYSTNYPTYNNLFNMIGVEGKWFFSDKWALRLNGASLLSATPGYEGVPGVSLRTNLLTPGFEGNGNYWLSQPTSSYTVIPTYSDVPARASSDVIINIGVDKYFSTKNEHLFWYASPVVNFIYSRATGFEVGGASPTVDPGTTRYGESFGIGLSGVCGAEYYTRTGIVFGFELRGVSYLYSYNSILPTEGMKVLSSDNHSVSFLSQPVIKVGFRFK